MTGTTTNRIAAVRKAKKWSQQKLADALGVHWVTISKLERGRMQLTQDWLISISNALEVPAYRLLIDESDRYRVAVRGNIRDGGRIELFDKDEYVPVNDDLDEDIASSWFMFVGDWAWPHFRDGDLLRFNLRSGRLSDVLVGRICSMWIEEAHAVVIGVLERSVVEGKFDLRPFNDVPLRNVEAKFIEVAVEIHIHVRKAPDTRMQP
ncbi:helix-turn-helix transcriptional regulator [Methylobacterium sp. WL69]|uniref:helix-turn-helix domain-containing protein n=1 Tax=Methylobacterium sp. WL69 TaxID=2603893 RepID=UPI0011CC6635|nr:helix-turn-helix transcriptional regulator [Methylobacterium sp. WL69]TXM71469.1 helix-turn-helix transcriptional regulator [Methylobacterium sp. WL69]